MMLQKAHTQLLQLRRRRILLPPANDILHGAGCQGRPASHVDVCMLLVLVALLVVVAVAVAVVAVAVLQADAAVDAAIVTGAVSAAVAIAAAVAVVDVLPIHSRAIPQAAATATVTATAATTAAAASNMQSTTAVLDAALDGGALMASDKLAAAVVAVCVDFMDVGLVVVTAAANAAAVTIAAGLAQEAAFAARI